MNYTGSLVQWALLALANARAGVCDDAYLPGLCVSLYALSLSLAEPAAGSGLLFFLYRTGSRTALVAMLLGAGVMLVAGFLMHSRRGQKLRMNLSRSSIVGLMVGSIVLAVFADVFTGGSLSSKARSFIVKYEGAAAYGESGLSSEELLASRQGQIDMMLHSIQAEPDNWD